MSPALYALWSEYMDPTSSVLLIIPSACIPATVSGKKDAAIIINNFLIILILLDIIL